jgi:ABC-2 type transport system ATP-binding protein
MNYALETADLSVEFRSRRGPVRALDRLSLRVEPGQVFGFLGPNGSGKTTTMHVLLGFIAPTAGWASIFGSDVGRSIARRRIGYLPENPDLYPFLTGRELLRLTGALFELPRRVSARRAAELLDAVGLSDAADRRIATYSRGMMQRIGFAQALVNDPDLVILDEPTGGLDPFGRMDIRRLIEDLRRRGKTVFFSSHELSEVELVCDRVAILARGRVVAEGSAADLARPGENLERAFLRIVGAANEAGATAGKEDRRP